MVNLSHMRLHLYHHVNYFQKDGKKSLKKRKKGSVVSEIDSSIATEQFKCVKCGGNKTTYYTMQTRSSDESETIFITCLGCGRKWRK